MKIFKTSADLMTPWQAVGVLGLVGGQVLTKEALRDAYAPLVLQAHPDKNPGQEAESHDKTVRINAAKDILKRYIGRPLPSNDADPVVPPPTPDSEGFDDWYSNFLRTNNIVTGPQDRPRGAMSVAETDVLEWVKGVLAAGMRHALIRGAYQGFELMNRFGLSPYGPVVKTQRLPEDITPERLFEVVKATIPGFPHSIIDLQIKTDRPQPESWVTFLDNKGERGISHSKYRSLSFEPIKKKEPKQEGVGLSVSQVEQMLQTKGLSVVAGGSKYAYWGRRRSDSYLIRQAAKTLRVMSRKSGEWFGISNEFYYGKLTEQIVAAMVNVIDKRNDPNNTASSRGMSKTASFIVPPAVPEDFAMAVYRSMHNLATVEDWELLDVQPNALEMIRKILESNGVEEIERELLWWSKQLSFGRN
jgi:hypothetical protein